MRLPNKVAVITGASSGMGQATAVLFAQEGAKVAVVDIDKKAGQTTVDMVKQKGQKALLVPTDVTDSSQVISMVEQVMSEFGKIDILVTSAGIWRQGTILDTDEKLWDAIMNLNLRGMFLCCKYCIPEMIKGGGGSIVNISSECGIVTWKNQIAYNVSKAAVISLTKSIAIDFASQNIRANTVCPGTTETPMPLNWLKKQPNPEELRRGIEEIRPANRLGQPEEIAYGILYLASDESPYATGAVLSIDGGATVK
ncbi:SDR family oxidoreductase [Candidatus Aerophobetes bacterium]|nr:SDR family oxidoreductase [Candidatus Aerophobetes bacterium]